MAVAAVMAAIGVASAQAETLRLDMGDKNLSQKIQSALIKEREAI